MTRVLETSSSVVSVLSVVLTAATVAGHSFATEREALISASESITTADLKRHVDVLADDAFEGRAAGSRGGHAASAYLAKEFQRHKLKPAGADGTYFQPFFGNCRNILGLLEGSDPQLKGQYVVVGGHYDHVGYGSRSNSNGPIGFIHNGADDNASGVAAVLEAIEALAMLPEKPKRSILFALWDSEENGLNGSKHWMRNPTVPVNRLSAAINLDMIGRVRNNRLLAYGTRTSRGLRRLLSEQNADTRLWLDFPWEMNDDSDHHSFFAAGVPVMMFHSGLHPDYHRPSDDPPTVNTEGMQRVARLLLGTVVALADEPQQHRFRPQSRQEFDSTRESTERALASLPGRLGLRWDPEDNGDKPGVTVTAVFPGTAAQRAGLRPGDRIVRFAGEEVTQEGFASQVLAAANPVEAVVERSGAAEPLTLTLQLTGQPVRVGITWRVDDAEPTLVQVVRVVPGSPAARAGIQLFDRVYEINGQRFSSSDDFGRLLAEATDKMQLLIEANGRMRTVELTPLKPRS
jgi:hypothetical protein